MQWKSTANTLFYIILKAPGAAWETGTSGCTLPFFQGCISPKHNAAQNQALGSQFNPAPGFISADPPAICFFRTFKKNPSSFQNLHPNSSGLTGKEHTISQCYAMYLGAIKLPQLCWHLLRIYLQQDKKLMSISLERYLEVWLFPYGRALKNLLVMKPTCFFRNLIGFHKNYFNNF